MPRSVRQNASSLWAFQKSLLSDGIPLAWLVDVPPDAPAFSSVQQLFMQGRVDTGAELNFRPDNPITSEEWMTWGGPAGQVPESRAAAAQCLVESSAITNLTKKNFP